MSAPASTLPDIEPVRVPPQPLQEAVALPTPEPEAAVTPERRVAVAPQASVAPSEAVPTPAVAAEIVTREVYAELRRRLGSTFTTEELAELYDSGTGWVADVAVAAAPESPFAWDVRVVGDAAFARYVREAVDYAGGRRLNR